MADHAAPGAACRLDHLPHDVLDLIAQKWIEECTPLWDRRDVLELAASLSIAGGSSCTYLAQSLFGFLSPRLGMELPNGVSEGSSAPQVKAACKEWGLAVGGNKSALLGRLRDQVEDSVADEEGNPPQYCLVSGATRAELTGWRQRRISQSKCKEIFDLTKYFLNDLPFQWQTGGGFASKTYLLSDVKRIALKQWGSYQRILSTRQRSKDFMEGLHAATEARRQGVLAALIARGHTQAAADALVKTGHAGVWIWGNKDSESLDSACDSIEKFDFASRALQRHFMAALYSDTWKAPRSMSQYRAEFTRRERAADAALPGWVDSQLSLEAIQNNPAVPRSLLPRLEALWVQRQHQQQAQQAQGASGSGGQQGQVHQASGSGQQGQVQPAPGSLDWTLHMATRAIPSPAQRQQVALFLMQAAQGQQQQQQEW